MDDPRLAHLKARELRLLQVRTELLSEHNRLVQTSEWQRDLVAELSVRKDRLEDELTAVRAELDAVYRAAE